VCGFVGVWVCECVGLWGGGFVDASFVGLFLAIIKMLMILLI
jgi:hypothetical protein